MPFPCHLVIFSICWTTRFCTKCSLLLLTPVLLLWFFNVWLLSACLQKKFPLHTPSIRQAGGVPVAGGIIFGYLSHITLLSLSRGFGQVSSTRTGFSGITLALHETLSWTFCYQHIKSSQCLKYAPPCPGMTWAST